jgi:hypothetical protein
MFRCVHSFRLCVAPKVISNHLIDCVLSLQPPTNPLAPLPLPPPHPVVGARGGGPRERTGWAADSGGGGPPGRGVH